MSLKIRVGALVAAVTFGLAADAAAQQPVVLALEGNPNCAALNGSLDPALAGITSDYGFKLDAPFASGTYQLTEAMGTITGGAPDDTLNTVTVTLDPNDPGVLQAWQSTLGIDAVIMKGGKLGALVYVLDTKAGVNLTTPAYSDGKLPAISHVEFCYDYEVDVTKTAATSFNRTHEWTIDHAVQSPIAMFTGDSTSTNYTVTFSKKTTDSDWRVAGTITVVNGTPLTARVTSVVDHMGEGIDVQLSGCFLPIDLPPGGKVACDYHAALPSGASFTNIARVGTTGVVAGNSGTADVVFDTPTVHGYDTVTVDHGNGTSQTTSTSGVHTYARPVACDADQGSSTRTAAIVETSQSKDATLAVSCYALSVAPSASASYERTYNWKIHKTAAASTATLQPGTAGSVDFLISVTAAFVDGGHSVGGTVTVTNPAPIPAPLTGITVDVAGTAAACSGPQVIAAGQTVSCSYSAAVAGATTVAVTATATLQNTPSGTTAFSGSTAAAFGAPTSSVDACVAVSDAFNGGAAVAVDQACFSGASTVFSKSYPYSQVVGPYSTCGTSQQVSNTASVKGSVADASSTATVTIDVPCAPPPPPPPPAFSGCTRTIGYWKNHSTQLATAIGSGVWLGTAGGPKSLLVVSANGGITVLTTYDENGINKLRAQLLAAKLNVAVGTSNTVADTIAAADAFLANNTPSPWSSLKSAQKKQVDAWKTTLDNYNNGLLGPAHCQ